MRELPPGWATDLAVLRHMDAVIEDHQDHLLVRSPANPDFHWGNFILVTDVEAVNDAGRWLTAFEAAFPAADWVAIGLAREPADEGAWASRGLELELDEVLTTADLPQQTALPHGYTVRRLTGADWAQALARSVAENGRTGEQEPQSFERFMRAQIAGRRALSDRDRGACFGAFFGAVLVSELGIVRCGSTARYQSVGTSEDHRCRGLASHLLGVAARWAAGHGCDRWVIVTEATNPAGRVYRRVGFEPDIGNAQAYRKPLRADATPPGLSSRSGRV